MDGDVTWVLKKVLAFDAGGGSTRISKIGFDGSRLTLEQIARFPNGPVSAGATFTGIYSVYGDLLDGLRKAAGEDSGIVSLGIDTWKRFCAPRQARLYAGEPVYLP